MLLFGAEDSWLIEVGFIIQHKALDGDQHLQHGGI
jgi:hypothetical protein